MTYKTLHTQVSKLVDKKVKGHKVTEADSKSFASISELSSVVGGGLSEALTQIMLNFREGIKNRIISGLDVVAEDPPSNKVVVSIGKGFAFGIAYEILEEQTIEIPFDDTTSVFYINLYEDALEIDRLQYQEKLTIAKIIIPNPSVTNAVQNDKPADGYNGWIVSAKDIFFDQNAQFDDDSMEVMREVIGPILADNLIGNIRLSEDLKIINTAGTLVLNSNSMLLYDEEERLLAEYNRLGTFYYDEQGHELSRFTGSDARIGNIKITPTTIESLNHLPGMLGRGFQIRDDGYAEFQNVLVRGVIETSVFRKNTISAANGFLLVSNSSVLAEDMSSLDSATLTTKEEVFQENEVIRMKDAGYDEWMLVTDTSEAPTYVVTRDLSGNYAPDNNPTWKEGTAVVGFGIGSGTNTGFISLDASTTQSPFIDIHYRNSTIYDDYSLRVRLGNLEGLCVGYGWGLWTDNAYIAGRVMAGCCLTVGQNPTCCGIVFSDEAMVGYYEAEKSFEFCIPTGVFNLWDPIITAYDPSCNIKFQLCDGHLFATDIKLQDPNCECCYSFLSAGALKFHDKLGDVPYVKRICSGEAATGSTICLLGWTTPPEIMVGIKSLMSYNSANPGQCQEWDVYHDNVNFWCTGECCYGYCFDIHARLQVSGGSGSECIKDVYFGNPVCTGTCVCATRVRSKFQLWCHGAAPANWYYGILCYALCYRVLGSGTWCAYCYSYTQPHASIAQMTSTQDQYQCLNFPCNAQWEIMACQQSLSWGDSGIPSGGCQSCVCTIYGTNCSFVDIAPTPGPGNWCIACCYHCVIYTGIPSNVYCAILYWCLNGSLSTHTPYEPGPGLTACFTDYHTGWCLWCNRNASCGINPGYCCSVHSSACSYKCFCSYVMTWHNYQACDYVAYSQVAMSVCFNCQVICYYVYCGGADCCVYEKLYSLCDTYGCQCVLDPGGVLNWLAVAYT